MRINYDRFPYPLRDIRGTVRSEENRWTFTNLVVRRPPHRVLRRLSAPAAEGIELSLLFTAQAGAAGRGAVRGARPCAPAVQQAWTELQPRGQIDLRADVNYRTGEAKPRISVVIQPRPEPTIRPRSSPTSWKRSPARSPTTTARSRSTTCAQHDRTTIRTNGNGYFGPEGHWQFRLTGLTADQVTTSQDLVSALPEQLKKLVEHLRPSGSFSLHDGVLAFSGHPIDRFVNDLPRFITGRIADYLEADRPQTGVEGGRAFFGGKPVAIAGVVEELRKRGPRTSAVLDDDSGRMDVSFFDEQYQQYREILVKDALLLIEGKLRFDEFANTWTLRATKVSELERLREKEARRIVLKLASGDVRIFEKLQALLAQHRGGNCQVAAQFHGQGARGTFSFGAEWNVRPTPALIEALETLLGRGRLAVLYSPAPVSAGVTSISG